METTLIAVRINGVDHLPLLGRRATYCDLAIGDEEVVGSTTRSQACPDCLEVFDGRVEKWLWQGAR